VKDFADAKGVIRLCTRHALQRSTTTTTMRLYAMIQETGKRSRFHAGLHGTTLARGPSTASSACMRSASCGQPRHK